MSASRTDAVARKSLPLSAEDLADLELMRSSNLHRMTLMRLSHQELLEGASEARVLHALITAGLAAVREEVEAAGYAAMAAEEDAAARKASARRRPPRWADE